MEKVQEENITKKLIDPSNPKKLLLSVAGIALVLGTITGIVSSRDKSVTLSPLGNNTNAPKTAQQDNKTFRDFAEGTIKTKASSVDPDEYTEGTHVLEREGAVPVTLTSSVVDLSQYSGKKVKVYGETQKALEAGWLMDVGKVEEIE